MNYPQLTLAANQTMEPVDFWHVPARIAPNNFIYKSLSCWSYNVAVGCAHACRFCYVPDVSTTRGGLADKVKQHKVTDPDAQWGDYLFVRPFDEPAFLASLRKAEQTPHDSLNPDGNRAVMFCTTTDPYQVVHHAEPGRRAELQQALDRAVERALELILERSTLNVRILTRSPMARKHFDLFKKFGHRLMFGMSIPTMDNKLAKVYEPKAPAPSQRLATLLDAKSAGLNVYVAVAPTYPECTETDIRETMLAVSQAKPLTVFHEPINIRAENVQRIAAEGKKHGVTMRSEVFASSEAWRSYAVTQLQQAEEAAFHAGLAKNLHLWPDKLSLGSRAARKQFSYRSMDFNIPDGENDDSYDGWLDQWWSRISEWPK